ncbi:MAG: DUF1818 family protein [Alkalinema sp. RU_4_3]|nr:DUF1818 family protein [Alkalinema sp. RU_4_3]
MGRLLSQGPGWRVGYNPSAEVYSALVGDDHWAFELTAAELADLRRLANQLVSSLQAIAPELMAEETIELEAESDRLWVSIEGTVQTYQLRLILQQARCAEGSWESHAIPDFLQALSEIAIS